MTEKTDGRNFCPLHGREHTEPHCPWCAQEDRTRFGHPSLQPPRDLVEETWNKAYPDRRRWAEIGAEAQLEWRLVFSIYEALKAKL